MATDIDLGNHVILNLRLQPLASDPANPTVGDMYYSTASGRAKIYTSAGWITLDSSTASATVTPTANKIPLADSGGKIADGWLNTTIARLTSGLLALASGGTNANLSATGGTGQVVKQTSAGGALSVAALVAADVPSLDASKITSGILPVANGGTALSVIPKFRVNKNGTNQTGIVTSTTTLLTWSTEQWDTNNNFASNRFTPTVAGKYLFFAELRFEAVSAAGLNVVQLIKNGLEVARGGMPSSSGEVTQMTLCAIEDANGSTDYFELNCFQSSGVNKDVNGGTNLTYWGGTLLP